MTQADKVQRSTDSVSTPDRNAATESRTGVTDRLPFTLSRPDVAKLLPAQRNIWLDGMQRIIGNHAVARLNGVEPPVPAGDYGAAHSQSKAVERLVSSAGSGEPLGPSLQLEMEQRFHRDLASVRVHTDSAAHTLSAELGAKAVTRGDDIWFARGYGPHDAGLLTHEVAHVIQQREGLTAGLRGLGGDEGRRALLEARAQPDMLSTPSHPPAHDARPHAIAGDAPIQLQNDPRASLTQSPAPPAEANADTFTYSHITLSSNREALIRAVVEHARIHGYADTHTLLLQFEGFVSEQERILHDLPRYGSDVSGTVSHTDFAGNATSLGAMQSIRDAVVSLLNERDPFLARFNAVGIAVTQDVLARSKQQVLAEISRYGLQAQHAQTMVMPSRRATERRHAVGREERRNLSMAASRLLRASIHRVDPPTMTVQSHAQRARRAAYEAVRAQEQRAYPILAAYASYPDELRELAEGGEASAAMLEQSAGRILDNIDMAQREVGSDFNVLHHPRIVAWTKHRMGFAEDSLENYWLEEALNTLASAEQVMSIVDRVLNVVITVLLSAVDMAALPLAARLIVQTAATGQALFSVSETYHQYLLDLAFTETNFDRAMAISEAEPSFFWMAFGLIEGFAEGAALGAATQRFGGIVRSYNLVVNSTGAARSAAIEALRQQAGGVPGLWNRIVQHLADEHISVPEGEPTSATSTSSPAASTTASPATERTTAPPATEGAQGTGARQSGAGSRAGEAPTESAQTSGPLRRGLLGPMIGPTSSLRARIATLGRLLRGRARLAWAQLTGQGGITPSGHTIAFPNSAAARAQYQQWIQSTPMREAAVWFDSNTGSYAAVQGVGDWSGGGSVKGPSLQGNWQLLYHYHPERNFALQFPSVADFDAILYQYGGTAGAAQGSVQSRVSSLIDWGDPTAGSSVLGGMRVTHFGYDPSWGPALGEFFVIYETSHGVRVELHFRDMNEYVNFIYQRLAPGREIP